VCFLANRTSTTKCNYVDLGEIDDVVRFEVKLGHRDLPLGCPLFPQTADIQTIAYDVRVVQILLQKSFWGGERKFLEPLMRFTRGDVRDHIV
jgi:hypothetical protein